MKNIVLKVPTAIFVVLVILPWMIVGLEIISGEELLDSKYYDILAIIGSIVASVWLFSIVDYFQSKAPDFAFVRIIYVLLALELILMLVLAFGIIESEGVIGLSLNICRLIIFITAVVFITLLIRKVFYERAVWFIILETLIVIVGITTLTPEIKRNEIELLAKELE